MKANVRVREKRIFVSVLSHRRRRCTVDKGFEEEEEEEEDDDDDDDERE